MKALIVLEDKEKLSFFKEKLTQAGFDTICYQWLLKALDNIEEISPHVVIISAEDYPRHWKVFVQHVKANITENDTKIFLIASSLTESELEKIKILGISDIIYNFEDIEKIISLLTPKQTSEEKTNLSEDTLKDEQLEIQEETLETEQVEIQEESLETEQSEIQEESLETEQSEIQEKNEESLETAQSEIQEKNIEVEQIPTRKIVSSCTFFVTNPVTNRMILGKVKKYKYPTLIFIPNNKEDVKNLRFGQVFENCMLKQVVNNKELSSNHRCQIRGFLEDSIEFCLLH